MNILVSIIIPAYCVEKYIKRCVDSLISQKYQNIEIIIIDDGSTDFTGSICDKIALEDNRVYVFHQKNAGVSAARNYALNMVSGEYILFVDADDVVHKDYIYNLLNIIVRCQADIVFCKEKRFNDSQMLDFDRNSNSKCFIKQINKSQYDFFSEFTHSTVWGALYRKNCIEGLNFDENIYIAEDSLFFVSAFLNASKIVFLDDNLYGYFLRNNSETGTKQYNNKKITELDAWKKICEKVERYYPGSLFSISAHAVLGMNAYKGLKNLQHKRNSNKVLWNKCLKVLREERKYLVKSTIKMHNKLMYSIVCVFPRLGINIYNNIKRKNRF